MGARGKTAGPERDGPGGTNRRRGRRTLLRVSAVALLWRDKAEPRSGPRLCEPQQDDLPTSTSDLIDAFEVPNGTIRSGSCDSCDSYHSEILEKSSRRPAGPKLGTKGRIHNICSVIVFRGPGKMLNSSTSYYAQGSCGQCFTQIVNRRHRADVNSAELPIGDRGWRIWTLGLHFIPYKSVILRKARCHGTAFQYFREQTRN
jgi:hypothetical protein